MGDLPSLGDYNGDFVHPRLAVGGCPHPEDVPAFLAAGIRGIIDARACMLREHVIYICSLPETIHWHLLGTWDGIYPNAAWDAPSGRASAATTVCPRYLELMVERTMAVVRDHSPVLIHCGGGIGRSGNLAAVATRGPTPTPSSGSPGRFFTSRRSSESPLPASRRWRTGLRLSRGGPLWYAWRPNGPPGEDTRWQ